MFCSDTRPRQRMAKYIDTRAIQLSKFGQTRVSLDMSCDVIKH